MPLNLNAPLLRTKILTKSKLATFVNLFKLALRRDNEIAHQRNKFICPFTPSTGRQYTLLEKGVFSYEVMSLGVLGVVAVMSEGLG